MLRKAMSGALVALALAALACGPARLPLQPAPPSTSAPLPEISLVTAGGGLLAGDVVGFCLTDGGCLETEAPVYAASAFAGLPSGNAVSLTLTGPPPDTLTLALLPYQNDLADYANPADQITMTSPGASVNWRPAAAPGPYVLDVLWESGDDFVAFWFPVMLS